MKRRSLAVGASVAALALVLTACGTDSSKSSSSSGGSGAGSGTIAGKLVFGGPAEFKTRADGVPGLKKIYGVVFKSFKVTDTGGPVTITALKNGQIDAADLFTTDPSIQANNFVILKDPKSEFAAQNIVPIVNKAKATDGVKKVLNGISAKLTTENVGKMLNDVVTNKQDPAQVAAAWLKDQGLDATGTDASGASLTVGSANFPENVLLANIYSIALKAQGATIKENYNIGSREKYFPALQDGSIDVFPEYNGSVLYYLDKAATATSPDDVDKALATALGDKLVELTRSEAQDSDAIVVTKQTADKYKLTEIGDLAKSG